MTKNDIIKQLAKAFNNNLKRRLWNWKPRHERRADGMIRFVQSLQEAEIVQINDNPGLIGPLNQTI
jgi:hypothetical protein